MATVLQPIDSSEATLTQDSIPAVMSDGSEDSETVQDLEKYHWYKVRYVPPSLPPSPTSTIKRSVELTHSLDCRCTLLPTRLSGNANHRQGHSPVQEHLASQDSSADAISKGFLVSPWAFRTLGVLKGYETAGKASQPPVKVYADVVQDVVDLGHRVDVELRVSFFAPRRSGKSED